MKYKQKSLDWIEIQQNIEYSLCSGIKAEHDSIPLHHTN